MKVIDI